MAEDRSDETERPRTRRLTLVLALAMVGAVALSSCGSGADGDAVEIEATLGGVALADAGPGSPVPIRPDEQVVLEAAVTNVSGEPVEVAHLRLEGEMLGLTFVAYDTSVARTVAPGATETIAVPLDFFDLDGQGHGHLRSFVRAYDAERERLGTQHFAVDVRGRVLSAMGGFAIVLLVATVGSVLFLLRAIATGRLSENRLARAARFAVPGLGFGLLLASAFSILRVFPLPSTSWIPMVLIPTAAAAAVGLVIGAPDVDHDDGDVELEEDLAASMR